MRARHWLGALALLGALAWEFLAATTFTGDDHLFLAYARLAPHPAAALAADHHGGEYYRPLPMAIWWIVARLGGGAELPFALLALGLHLTSAALVAALGARVGLAPPAARLAGALFLVAPAQRDAALWFSASTDLLATAGVLGSILCLFRGSARSLALSCVLAACAYLSKESALVLPLLALASLAAAGSAREDGSRVPWRQVAARVSPHVVLAALVAIARWQILGGAGGSGDPGAALSARALQIGAGLATSLVGTGALPHALALAVGAGAALWAGTRTAVPARGTMRLALAWMLVAVLPLPLAGWVVGSRYFYMATPGMAWLVARALAGRAPALQATVLVALAALGAQAAAGRRADVAEYRARLAAAEDAVATGLRAGHRTYRVKCGIKDLDLALKGRPRLRARDRDFLAIPDVPASFALVPPDLESSVAFLRASPPLPPSGAYHFGGRRIVGLARRDEAPDLDTVRARLPDLRLVELVATPGKAIAWRDVTPGSAAAPARRQ